ncbi:sulfatase-like hydrolase/transferase [Flagellimonas sp. 2504JD1-5]
MKTLGRFLFSLYCICNVSTLLGQENDAPKVVLITIDGLRWQELFTGADPLLVANKEFVGDTVGLKNDFWRDSAEERRKVLMPFLWNEVVNLGQLHGNRNLDSKMNLTNTMWFSYPGYNEILTGKADDARIDSNSKINNPNTTVLERYNSSKNGNGKVAAFGSWDVFPYIVNEERSGIPVNAGFEPAKGNLSKREVFLNQLQKQIPSPWSSVRLDAFTHHYTLEYMKKEHPKLVYIAYGETDDFAHGGDYQAYLKAVNNTDSLIKEVWDLTQKDDFYKDETIFIITTDHGRGTKPLHTWQSHGSQIPGADQVWLVVFGKGIEAMGEVDKKEQLFTDQVAPTIMKILGLPIGQNPKMGRPLDLIDVKQMNKSTTN